MIKYPGYSKIDKVYEITEQSIDFGQLRQEWVMDPIKDKPKNIKEYTAPSTSVLVCVKPTYVDLSVGRFVTEKTLENVLGFCMKQGKEVKIWKCEVISSLRSVDLVVVLCNQFLKEKTDEEQSIDLES